MAEMGGQVQLAAAGAALGQLAQMDQGPQLVPGVQEQFPV